MRAVLYARYSTDLQSASSIADQHRALREALPRLGLREVSAHSDAAISGSSLARPGLEDALGEIEAGRADVLVAEALDRISRDLEHVARIAKRIAFRGARIVTLSEGEIGALHIGLSGTMAQLYLEQLAEKTRRGLRGVVADGRIAAGRAYGYRPTAERGRFEIVEEEAEVVRRIMREYAAGISPRSIAKALNAESIPGPRGGTWKGNTILGDRTLGVGIVNNRLYIGDVIWNRSTWRKNPRTGRRQPFPLPESEWVVTRAEHLRIVDEALWEAVRMRQGDLVKRGSVKRPTRPLSGLLVCGACGHRLTIVGADRYGCPVHKEQGLCTNGRTVPAADAERRVLEGLRTHLCHPEAVAAYSAAYVAERKRLRAAAAGRDRELRRELGELEREQDRIVNTIGRVPEAAVDALARRLGVVAERIVDLREDLAALPGGDSVVDLQRVSAEHLSRNLDTLWARLQDDPVDAAQARSALGALISRIVMEPESKRGQYSLVIEGDLAAFLGLSAEGGLSDLLVAGARKGRIRNPQVLAAA